MKNSKHRITLNDYLKANRRAARMEEIEAHGHLISFRPMIHKSKKIYNNRNILKRIKIEQA